MNLVTTILRDIGDSLRELFSSSIDELRAVDAIRFDSPGEMSEDAATRLSIFLYQISINPHLRNEEGMAIGERQIRHPHLPVDLNYIFTVYAKQRETELNITEQLARVMYDNSVLKGDLLKGNLLEQFNTEIYVVPVNLSLDDLNKLWGTFLNKPFKLSLCYQLTPVMLPSDKPLRSITRVTSEELNTYWKPSAGK